MVACGDCGHGMTVYTASVPDNQERFQHPRYIESRDIQHTTIRAIAAAATRNCAPSSRPRPDRGGLRNGRVPPRGVGGRASRDRARSFPRGDIPCPGSASRPRRPVRHAGDVRGCRPVRPMLSLPSTCWSMWMIPSGCSIQMRRLLRPGGLAYIRVPNLDTWFRRVLGRNWWGFSVEHVGHFTADSISRAFAAASLDVVAVRSGDSDPRSSMWPLVPLLLRRGAVMRRVGAALQPPAGRAARRRDRRASCPARPGRAPGRQETVHRRRSRLSADGHHRVGPAHPRPAWPGAAAPVGDRGPRHRRSDAGARSRR